jgi:hypothetical protein
MHLLEKLLSVEVHALQCLLCAQQEKPCVQLWKLQKHHRVLLQQRFLHSELR